MKFYKLITPCLIILGALGLSISQAYALFTSKDESNIAITAGKVNLSAELTDLTLYSPTLIGLDGAVVDDTNAATTTFYNKGTAVINGNTLNLSNITPGDKATFKISFTNNSNIDIKYRVSFIDATTYTGSETNKLIDVLEVKCGTGSIESGEVIKSWTLVEPDDEIDDLTISVELPTNVGSIYRDLTSNLKFSVEAVQGNAKTADVVELTATNGTDGDSVFYYCTEADYEFKAGTTYSVTATTTTTTLYDEEFEVCIMFACFTSEDVENFVTDNPLTLATLISFKDDGVELDWYVDIDDDDPTDVTYFWFADDDWENGHVGEITAEFTMLIDYTGTFFFSLGL